MSRSSRRNRTCFQTTHLNLLFRLQFWVSDVQEFSLPCNAEREIKSMSKHSTSWMQNVKDMFWMLTLLCQSLLPEEPWRFSWLLWAKSYHTTDTAEFCKEQTNGPHCQIIAELSPLGQREGIKQRKELGLSCLFWTIPNLKELKKSSAHSENWQLQN